MLLVHNQIDALVAAGIVEKRAPAHTHSCPPSFVYNNGTIFLGTWVLAWNPCRLRTISHYLATTVLRGWHCFYLAGIYGTISPCQYLMPPVHGDSAAWKSELWSKVGSQIRSQLTYVLWSQLISVEILQLSSDLNSYLSFDLSYDLNSYQSWDFSCVLKFDLRFDLI